MYALLNSWIICSIHRFTRRAFLRLVVMPWSLYHAMNKSVRPSTVGWRGIISFTFFFTFFILSTSAAVGYSWQIWSSWLSLTSLEEYSRITLHFTRSPSGTWVTFPSSPVNMGWLYLDLSPSCLDPSASVSISSPLDEKLVLSFWCVDIPSVFVFLAICLVFAICRPQSSDRQTNIRLQSDPLHSLFILPELGTWSSGGLVVR